jgi:hypothetical protein
MVKKIKIAITQEDFIKKGQVNFGTLSQEIVIPAQYSWRNEEGRIVFSDSFTITVNGNNQASICTDQLVRKDAGASNRRIAFDANAEGGSVKEVYIPHTLETVAEREECKAVYKLLVRSNLANG